MELAQPSIVLSKVSSWYDILILSVLKLHRLVLL